MKIEDGHIVLGRKACHNCQEGTQPSKEACSECQGTGKGKRGKANGCKKCNGYRHQWNHDKRVTCSTCSGNYAEFQAENDCDYLPADEWEKLEFRVIRNGPGMTFGESVLGFGCVYSSVDYGRAWSKPDADTLAEVVASNYHQACKVADKTGKVCTFVGIFISPTGYVVRACFA